MNCEEFWNTAPGRDLDGPHAGHLRECAGCQAQREAEGRLSEGLRAMAAAAKSVEAPARVEFRLVQAFRRQNGIGADRRSRTARQPWLAALAWTTAAATLAIALLLAKGPQPQPVKPARGAATQYAVNNATDDSAFGLTDNASEGDNDDSDVVRLEVPRSAMMALGYDVNPDRATERVEAEVTLGADGQAKSVRFIDE